MIQQSLHHKLDAFTVPGELKREGIYPYFRPIGENHDTEVIIQGKKLLMFGSNSYMGLTNHPKVVEAAIKAIGRYGSSCSGSRFLNGTSCLHIELEEKLEIMLARRMHLFFQPVSRPISEPFPPLQEETGY